MEMLIGFFIVILVLAALDFAAIRWGTTVRDTRGDWTPVRQDETWISKSSI